MSSEAAGGLKVWAIVELMGHQQIAGLVTEELIAGKPMLRVDVPAREDQVEGFTRFYGASSLYALTPCSEADVRSFVGYYRPRRAPVYLPENTLLGDAAVVALPAGARRCRVCGCTDDDCSQCIEKIGEPCSLVDEDDEHPDGPICTACADDVMVPF